MHVQDTLNENFGNWRWAATECGVSSHINGSITMTLPRAKELWNVTVYLPVWVPVDGLYIGVGSGEKLVPLRLYPAGEKPIYLWGSRIAQGGVTTNAGNTWPVNLQRIMNLPLLNFGFSGSC